MLVQDFSGLSLAIILTLTLLHVIVTSASPLLTSVNQERTLLDTPNHPLVRHTRHAKRHLPCIFMPQILGIKSQFERMLDHNNDGRAGVDEVRKFITKFRGDVEDDVIRAFIGRRDQNGNGEIDLIPEYLKEMTEGDYGQGAANEWFYLHDVNGDGFVTEQELIRTAVKMGMKPDQAQVTALEYYLPYDADRDGKLNLKEFSVLYAPPMPHSA